MGAPAYAAAHGEKRGVEIARDVEHVVDEPRVKIDVGADVFGAGMELLDDRRAELLDHLVELHLVKTVLGPGELSGLPLQKLGAGIRNRIYRMSQPVDEARPVARLLLGDLSQVRLDGLGVVPILHVFLYLVHLLHDAQIRSSVAGPLEGKNGRGYRRIDVGVGARHDVGYERGVVSAAVLRMKNERQIESLGLKLRVAPVLADKGEKVLRARLLGIGVADHERAAHVIMHLRLIRVCGDRRHDADYGDGSLKAFLDRKIVEGVLFGNILERHGEENRAGDGVHDIGRRMAQNRVFLESVGKFAVHAEFRLPIDEFARRGKFAEHQKIRALLVTVAVLLAVGGDEILHAYAAIVELAGDRDLLAFGNDVAVNVAYGRKPHEDAGSVIVAQTAFHAVLSIQ